MSSPYDLGRLDTTAWERLQDLAERLECMWREQGPVDLNMVLPPVGDPARLPYLVELIKTDLEIRWRRNQGVRLDWYVERFEELGVVSELSPRLIYEEFRVRQLHGDKPDLSSYKRRFPRQFPEVEQLVMAEPIGTVSPALPTPVTPPPPAKGPAPMGSNVVVASEGYRLIERIGTGSFGEVWRAEAPGGVLVAVKIIYRPVGSDADQHEKKAIDRIKNLSHPFLLGTHGYWISSDGRLHIAMDLADGTLRDRLKDYLKRGQAGIPPEELLRQMDQSAQALDYVHGEGLYHRDIKPDNILLKKGFAKVGDFSLVRNQETLSIDSAAAGTLAYMGPECFRGNVVKQSDQYSLAVTYIELRTNRRPFPTRTNWYDAMLDAVDGAPEFGTLDGLERDALTKALAKKPEDRFPSCLAFVEALKKAITPEPIPVRDEHAWLQPGRRVGPEGHNLVRRLSGSSAVGQFWEAVAPGGKHVALQVIENLDGGGVLKHLRAYDLARCFTGAANILQVYGNWLADGSGEVKSLADVIKPETEERVALVVAQELADDDMAHLLGGSRRKVSDERLDQLLANLRQAALALDHINAPIHSYARRKQLAIRHCGVRPENLMLVGNEVRVAHFDLAQEVTEPVEPLRVDSLDLEPGYAAPELLERGGGQVTAFSDQYSLAMTYVKLRTGSLPFDQSQSRNRIIEEQLNGKPNLKVLPERERPVIAKATERRPQDRYPNCEAMIAALEAVCRVAQAEVVIEPPSVHEETLLKKPPTEPRVPDRPTPPRGNWRDQGLRKQHATDVTLIPDAKREEPAADSVFEEHAPPEENPRPAPRREPTPRRPSRRPRSRAKLVIALLIVLLASIALAALVGQFVGKPPKQDPEATETGEFKVGSTDTVSPKQGKGVPPGIPGPGELKLELANVTGAFGKILQDLREHDAERADERLTKLGQELQQVEEPGRKRLHEALEAQVKANRLQLLAKDLDVGAVKQLIERLEEQPFAVANFELAWIKAGLLLRKSEYGPFLAAVELLAKSEKKLDSAQVQDVKELLAQARTAATGQEQLESFITVLPGHCQERQIAAELVQLLLHEVSELVKLRYAHLREIKEFDKLASLCSKATSNKNADALTLACLVECLLRRSPEGFPGRNTPDFKEAQALARQLADSNELYVTFVRGLLFQVSHQWAESTELYSKSFASIGETWQDESRKLLAADAYYKAADHVWHGEKDATKAKEAVKHFQGAAKLVERMPVAEFAQFTLATYTAQDMPRFVKQLTELSQRDLQTIAADSRRGIVLAFAEWADGNPVSAVSLLRRAGKNFAPLFRAIPANEPPGEALDYWLGRYEWEFGDKRRAKTAFGRSLAESKPSQDFYKQVRLDLVEEILGGLRETASPEDWLEVFRAAIPDAAQKRTDRQWELLLAKYKVVTQNPNMRPPLFKDLEDAKPEVLRDLHGLIEYSSSVGRTDLPSEARMFRLDALISFMKTPTFRRWSREKQTQAGYWKQVCTDYHDLADAFSNRDTFKKWKRPDKVEIAEKIATDLQGLADEALKGQLIEGTTLKNDSGRIRDAVSDYEKGKTKPADDGNRSLRRETTTAIVSK
jgi:serine/threonine protein kinase